MFSAVKQLKFEIYIILCQYSYQGSENKTKFDEINISDSNFLSSSYGNALKKCEVWKIYHAEYGLFLQTDWLKSKGSGRVMG